MCVRRNLHLLGLVWLIICMLFVLPSSGAENAAAGSNLAPLPVNKAIRDAVEAGLPLLVRSARAYTEKKSCFSCHHQTLPVLAAVTAAGRGHPADRDWVEEQTTFTRETFASRVELMRQGKGVGGASMTVGYGLWSLDLAGREADDVTDAMIEFLIARQEEDGFWKRSTHRPPLEESNPFATLLATYYMDKFAREEQRGRLESSRKRAAAWLEKAEPVSQEDANALLWHSVLETMKEEDVTRYRRAVLARQNDDGGWSQLSEMASDAYATGQTMFILLESGMAADSLPVARAVQFLLGNQKDDGSWFVETRSRPVQRFFDNGDPHGKHQFISTASTAWAVAALARALPGDATGAP